MFEYKLQRRYVLVEKEGLPPFIVAETVGMEYGKEEVRKAHPDDPRVHDMTYSSLDEEAGQIETVSPTRILSREELEASPDWAEALRRWEVGDDLVYVEHERLVAISNYERDLVDWPSNAEGTPKYLAEAARAGGSLLPA